MAITELDILAAAELALPHRLKRLPFRKQRIAWVSFPTGCKKLAVKRSTRPGASMTEPSSAGKKKS